MDNFESEIVCYYRVIAKGKEHYERTKFKFSTKTFEEWCRCQKAIIVDKLNYLMYIDKKKYIHYRELFNNSQQLTINFI